MFRWLSLDSLQKTRTIEPLISRATLYLIYYSFPRTYTYVTPIMIILRLSTMLHWIDCDLYIHLCLSTISTWQAAKEVDQDRILGPTLTTNDMKVDGATAHKIDGLPTSQVNNPTTIPSPCLLQIGENVIATDLWIRFLLFFLYINTYVVTHIVPTCISKRVCQ